MPRGIAKNSKLDKRRKLNYGPYFKKRSIPERLKSVVVIRDKNVCQNCGKKGKIFGFFPYLQVRENIYEKWVAFEISHIIPEPKGGKNILENLILLCRYCNRSLGTKIWLPSQEKE